MYLYIVEGDFNIGAAWEGLFHNRSRSWRLIEKKKKIKLMKYTAK